MRILRLTFAQAGENTCPEVRRDDRYVYVDADSECWQERRKQVAEKFRATKAPQSMPSSMELSGPLLWAELHRWSMTADLSNSGSRRWLANFATRIPCGQCAAHWHELLMKMPPDFSSNEKLFEWSVAAHNRVNHDLGKSEMTIEDATALWASSPNTPAAGAA